ncbi:MAG: hypothetical protein HQL53_14310, partial [Magnetococcales bacterium]|nr:hypothetical protein [Magnetococcales bacterium]
MAALHSNDGAPPHAVTLLRQVYVGIMPWLVLAMLLVWFAIHPVLHEHVQNDVQERLNALSSHQASLLVARLDTLHEQVKGHADSDLLINSLIDQNARDEYLSGYIGSITFGGIRPWVVLGDYRGRPIHANRAAVGTLKKNPILTPGESARVLVGEPFIDLSKRGLRIATPVLYSGSAEGILQIFFPVEMLADVLALKSKRRRGVELLLIDGAERIVYASHDDLKQSASSSSSDEISEWLQSRVRLQSPYDLLLVMAEPASVMHEAMSATLWRILLAMVGLLLIILLLIHLTTRKVTKPLHAFIDALQEMSRMKDLSQGMHLTHPPR